MSDSIYYQNIIVDKKTSPQSVTFDIEVKKQTNLRVALRDEMIKLAQGLSRENENEMVGLLLADDFESALTALSFHHAHVPFKVYQQVFVDNQKTEPTKLEKFLAELNIEVKRIPFDFENEEHFSGLEKLQQTTLCTEINILFQIWASCFVDEKTILPGRFLKPFINRSGELVKWVFIDSDEMNLYDFFKPYGAVPSFLSACEAVIKAQAELSAYQCVIEILKKDRRVVPTDKILFRTLLAEQFGFVEISRFQETERRHPAYRSSLSRCNRSTKERFSMLLSRIRMAQTEVFVNSDIDLSTTLYHSNEKDKLLYQELFSLSKRTDVSSHLIDSPDSTSQNSYFAAFPTLISTHQFEDEVERFLEYVKGQEYFKNYDNFYTRTNLHFDHEMDDLSRFFEKNIARYFDKMGYAYDDFEIVQCWANKSGYQQSHHIHTHPNCILSGVFYLTSDGGGNTMFSLENQQRYILINQYKRTSWNASFCEVAPVKGRLVLFPSYLFHQTLPHNVQGEFRYTIAFNVMVRGELGEIGKGSWLQL